MTPNPLHPGRVSVSCAGFRGQKFREGIESLLHSGGSPSAHRLCIRSLQGRGWDLQRVSAIGFRVRGFRV